MGRATLAEARRQKELEISIHALRGEGDGGFMSLVDSIKAFQSTPSVGRATKKSAQRRKRTRFQSTPSVGRATRFGYMCFKYIKISIHALRGEGDEFSPYCFVASSNFNPRPPWGGRHRASWFQSRHQRHFNPRPPWGGRREENHRQAVSARISIHALRGEGDCCPRLI